MITITKSRYYLVDVESFPESPVIDAETGESIDPSLVCSLGAMRGPWFGGGTGGCPDFAWGFDATFTDGMHVQIIPVVGMQPVILTCEHEGFALFVRLAEFFLHGDLKWMGPIYTGLGKSPRVVSASPEDIDGQYITMYQVSSNEYSQVLTEIQKEECLH